MTYRDISTRTEASIGTISEIIKEYRQRSSDLDDLRKLHLELRKAKINLPDALRGARFLRNLDELELDRNYLAKCLKFTKDAGGRAPELAIAGSRLIELEKKTGKPYEQLFFEFDEKLKAEAESSKRVKIFEDKELKLRNSIRHLDKLRMLQETMDRHSITPTLLEGLIAAELRLRELGFTSQQAEVLAQELTRRRLDPSTASAQIATLLRESLDLEEAKKKSKEEAEEWASKLEKAKSNAISLKEEIQRQEDKLKELKENYANREKQLEKEYEALQSKLKAEYDAEQQKLEKEKNKLKSQIGDLEDTLNTDIQNLELAKANTSEAQDALQTVKDSVERDKIFGVIVTLIKRPEALKSQPDVLEATIAILGGFDSYLEKTDLFKWRDRPKLRLRLDELLKHMVEELH
jgi:myosin heavy subunit